MTWSWLKRRITPPDEVPSPSEGLGEAREARREAEKQLRAAQIAAREVRRVSIQSRLIRQQNQFSQRLSEAFGSRPQGG